MNVGSVPVFFYSLADGLPKLDLIPIWISDPRKVPVRGVLRGLFDGHALALKMLENFFQDKPCEVGFREISRGQSTSSYQYLARLVEVVRTNLHFSDFQWVNDIRLNLLQNG